MGKQSLGKDAIWLTGSKIVNLLIAMFSAMLLSRFRSLEEYGTYSQINMVVTLATALFMMGLPNSINYFYPRAESQVERDRFLSTYYSFSTLLSAAMGAMLLLASPILIWYFNNDRLDAYSYVLAILPWTNVIIGSVGNILVASHKAKKLTLYTVANSVALLLSILVVRWLDLSFAHYMIIYILVEVVFAVWVYWEAAFLTQKPTIHIDWHLVRQILVFSMPMGLASVVGTLNRELGKLIIGRFLGTDAVAIYANAGKEMPITFIAASFTAVLMPRLARMMKKNDISGVVQLWGDSITLNYILICFFSSAMFVLAPQVMSFLYSEKYSAGISVFQIYSLVLLWRTAYFGMILNVTGKTKYIFYSSMISLLLNVILSYLFYRIFGFTGPAVAAFISVGVIQMAQLYASSKVTGIKFRNIFPWGEMARITFINICLGAIAFSFVKMAKLGTTVQDVGVAIGFAIFWFLIYLFIIRKIAFRKWKKINEVKYD